MEQLAGGRWPTDDKARTTDGRILHLDPTTQRPNRFRHHGQPKPGTPAVAAPGIIETGEPLEDSRPIIHRNTGTIIINPEPNAPGIGRESDLHAPGTVPGCVVEQVGHDATDQFRRAENPAR